MNSPEITKQKSVQPEWCLALPIQQQSVLFLAARGPDGIAKQHPCKRLQRAYCGSVLVAARFGRCLEWGETADTFMGLDEIASDHFWPAIVKTFFQTADELPHHFYMHLIHGAEIIGYKHPDETFRERWLRFYFDAVTEFHLTAETERQMDARLSDWNQQFWR